MKDIAPITGAGDLAIRPARDGDHEACADVFLAAYRQAFPHHSPDYYAPNLYYDSIAGEQQFVALVGGEIIAVLSIYWPENFIHSLYVRPSRQGGGIGRRLLEAVLARARGVCELKCDRANQRAIAFYRHLGWREVGEGIADTGPWVRLRK
ncbi:MAG TPA: GNAT family N-acetyltransferase [Candidatus Cybelea sp.]|nr:GNAT family N-acetyltransferase [Candidatus Cybelea sp.]